MSVRLLNPGVDAPFPWPGSKRRVADVVWDAFGDVDRYIEPFAGSLAVLLRRPERHRRRIETINDLDGMVSNFWRAVRSAPDEVASHLDYPVSHVDLHARHVWLNEQRDGMVARLAADPDWCDPKAAGWWAWGLSAWIGTGWCDGTQRPHLGDAGQGVHTQRPHLGDAGKGVHTQRPHFGNAGQGVHLHTDMLADWMRALSARLRHVRLMHGDWTRCVSSGLMTAARTTYGRSATTGVFLDPPYDPATLATDRALYSGGHDRDLSAQVRDWAIDAARQDPAVRIALCGYEQEHGTHMPPDWAVHAWSSNGMQATKTSGSNQTRHGERIWFSPGCRRGDEQPSMFEEEP